MAKFGVGQPVRRVEDQRFLTGQGRYVDDIVLPGMLHACNVLSPHAHAKIKKVDVSKAKAAPGVLLVLTGADAVAEKIGALTSHLMPEDFGAPKGHRTFQPLLVSDRVRHVGDRVAFVVAETLAQARDAAELVEVDYEPLPALVNIEDAAKPDAMKVWDDNPAGNNAFRLMFGSKEATDAAFASAKHVVKLRVENNRLSPVSMEPRVAIGDYAFATDETTLYSANQNPHGARMEVSHIFHVPENRIRVVSPDVGGGFGLKGGFFPEDGLVVWAARKLRRPVKWVSTRSEAMLNDHHAREMVYYGELALDEQRQDSRPALEIAVPDGRLLRRRGARRRRLLDPLRARRLRHPDHAHHVAGRVHQHLAERAVSRRRPPGGRVLHGAADRARRQRHRHRPRRDPPPQSHPREQAALHHADALGLRLRRVRPPDGPLHGEQRLEGLRRAPARTRRRTASCAAARSASTSSSAASSTTAWT